MNNKKTLEVIRNFKIPKKVDFRNTTLLMAIVSKGFLAKGNASWYANGGFVIFNRMDWTVVGAS